MRGSPTARLPPRRTGRSWTGSPGPTPPSVQSSVAGPPSPLLRPSCRPRISSQRLQHPLLFDALRAPLQKNDLQGLLPHLPFQFGDLTLRPAPGPVARESIARPLAKLSPPAVQNVGFTSDARAASAIEIPCSSRRTAAGLHSFVNCLRDNPMTQFSIQWILSLNRLSQNGDKSTFSPAVQCAWFGCDLPVNACKCFGIICQSEAGWLASARGSGRASIRQC